ncbi:MAG: universal stress protein [Silvibacterium sp.]|nr:universal stress protein [Silvibacterium sp.]
MTTTTIPEVSFKEILVASDLSDASRNAIGYAKAIARHYGSHIVLAHVSDPAAPIAIPEGGWIQETANQIEEQMQAAGLSLRAEGLPADAVNTYGSIRREIEALADEYQTDLIVLGTHGRRGLKRVLFGSEAEGLLRRTSRPVLTVGPAAAPPPKEAWAPKNILCATSLNPRAAQVVAYAYKLAKGLGASFELLSVDDPKHPADADLNWRTFEDALAEALPEELAKGQIRSLISGKSPADNIVDVAKAVKSDLIVMGARTTHFASTHMPAGVLAQVLADAPCPVLTLAIE